MSSSMRVGTSFSKQKFSCSFVRLLLYFADDEGSFAATLSNAVFAFLIAVILAMTCDESKPPVSSVSASSNLPLDFASAIREVSGISVSGSKKPARIDEKSGLFGSVSSLSMIAS